MTITIHPFTKIRDIQNTFHQIFPNLKIVFLNTYSNPTIAPPNGSLSIDPDLRQDILLGELGLWDNRVLTIEANMAVKDVIAILKENMNIYCKMLHFTKGQWCALNRYEKHTLNFYNYQHISIPERHLQRAEKSPFLRARMT
jgi:hypothetical protein